MPSNYRHRFAIDPGRADLAGVSFDTHAEALRKKSMQLGVAAVIGIAVGVALTRLPPLIVAGILFGVAGAVIVLLKPFVGLLLYTAVFELRPAELYPVLAPLRLEKVVGAMTLLALFLAQYRQSGRIVFDRSRQSCLLLLFVASVFMSVPNAYWRGGALNGFSTMTKALAFYIMVLQLIDSRRRLKWFLATYWILILYIVGNPLQFYFEGKVQYTQGIDRIVGATGANKGANFLGSTIVSVFPLFLLMTTMRLFRGWRFLIVPSCMALLYTLVLTGSRGSLLGFLTGLVCLWWGSRRRLLLGVFGVAFLVIGFFSIPDQYRHRYATITSGQLDESSQGRLAAWTSGLRMFSDKPVFGIGVDNFLPVRWEREQVWLEAHSLYITVLTETGLVGSIAFFAFIAAVLLTNRRTRRRLQVDGKDWEFERKVLTGLNAGFIALLAASAFGGSPMLRTWYVFSAASLAITRLYLDATPGPMSVDPSTAERPS